MPPQVECLMIMCIALLPLERIAAEEPAPDLGFLEYLGRMVEEDGQYLDLMDLAEVEELPGTTRAGHNGQHPPESPDAVEVAP